MCRRADAFPQQEFTIEDDQFGEKKIVELKEDGSTIPVTEDNKEEYVRLVVSYRLDNSIKDQIKAFLDGFYEWAVSVSD
jgi:E3 ubiquitin-protein ligase HUWE1